MDDLRAEFARLKSRKDSRRRADLRRFQEKLGRLRFFDPACGCGNFLIIAYRELRLLEMEVIRAIHGATGQDVLDVGFLSQVDVDQFHGIELGEFPARIAETALWMMDHIMNNRLSLEFGRTYTRIPLQKAPRIVQGDAPEIDWSEVLPADQCAYVLGNPALRRRQVPDRGTTRAGAPHRGPGRQRRHAGLRRGLAHQGGELRDRRDPHRLRSHQFDDARRAGRATLAAPVRPLRTGDCLRAPHLRLGFGRTRQGARARRHPRFGPAGQHAGREAAVFIPRPSTATRRRRATRRCRRICLMPAGCPSRI